MTDRRNIAFVLPIYNEEGNIPLLYERLTQVAERAAERYVVEFIFIDDGSRDRSLELLRALRERDERVSVYSLARNRGHQIAVTAGIDVADADAVIVMDSDLQDPPEVALDLIAAWEQGADVAYAKRRTRDDGFLKRLTAGGYYWTLSKLARIDIPRDTGDFRLMDRRVVEELRRYPERNRFIRGMVAEIGFRQEAVLFDRDARHAGTTGYPLGKMLKLAADGILGFSSFPLRLISALGLTLAVGAGVWTLYLAISRIVAPENQVEGWTFLAAGMFLLGGIQLLMLGVLGQYIGRIYEEVQHRPLYAFAVRETGPHDPA
ncbi:glycosyltransferase family 2 protein [Microbacterium amylolyticum]|uniref:Dolichol-phosphate mannosyltransferase n=1 Tax=Microbacterium amylolyticum TaxID=936337 RepID=A0ABS4ZJF3_9MICO|nr:glycosyltransferase family 2 protein [Microbacterium amylolyticum]MBP2437085.1 dolichol-phosphate mannosyltransferase [Microbacterium amylolyticum]